MVFGMRMCLFPSPQKVCHPGLLLVAILGFVLGSAAEGWSPAWGEVSKPSATSPGPSGQVVLLLRNGHVVEGTVVVEGDTYRVKVPDGELYLPRRSVLAVAPSMRELYEQQKARVFGQDAEPHLELAIWCAEHGLAEEARTELAQARALAPDHPGLALATRRVEMALSRCISSGDGSSLTGLTPPGGKRKDGMMEASGRPEQAPGGPSAPGVGSPQPLPGVPDPRILLRGLPEEAREEFVRVIQPIVSHNCASARCHGNPDLPDSLRLCRLSPDRVASRGQTAQNLQTVLGWVDYANPGASPLLTKPLQPHGGLPAPVFSGVDMKQYRDLVDWVYKITRQRTPPAPLERLDTPTGSVGEPPQAAAGIELDGIAPLSNQSDEGIRQAGFLAPSGGAPTSVIPAAAALPFPSSPQVSPVIRSGTLGSAPKGTSTLFEEPVRFPIGEFLGRANVSQVDGMPQGWPGERLLPTTEAVFAQRGSPPSPESQPEPSHTPPGRVGSRPSP